MTTEGHWISPDGGVLEVAEHFEAIRSDPPAFGFTLREAQKWTRDDREAVLRKAMKKGWTRVRGHRNSITFELYELDADRATYIRDFLQGIGAWENDPIEVHESRPGGKAFRETADFFLAERHLALLGARPRGRRRR